MFVRLPSSNRVHTVLEHCIGINIMKPRKLRMLANFLRDGLEVGVESWACKCGHEQGGVVRESLVEQILGV